MERSGLSKVRPSPTGFLCPPSQALSYFPVITLKELLIEQGYSIFILLSAKTPELWLTIYPDASCPLLAFAFT